MRFIHAFSAAACAALLVGCGSGDDEVGGSGASAGAAGTAAGSSGASGTTGASGTSGTTGVSGTSGTTGDAGTAGTGGTSGTTSAGGSSGTAGSAGAGGTSGTAGTDGAGGSAGTSGTAGTDGAGGSAGTDAAGGMAGSAGTSGSSGASGTAGAAGTGSGECTETGAADNFSFFVTSYQGIIDLAGNEDGFGGDLRYNGAATGLEGADAICQELARRVCFGHRTWRAYLSTSTVNAKDRVGPGPWYDHAGLLVANDLDGLLSGDRPAGGANAEGTYDETGIFHDGHSDVNNDGMDDDDHDTLTATLEDGTYAGFSCNDWTSTTATSGGGGGQGGPGGGGGIQLGHSWPAGSGQHWATAHAGHQCAAGTNFIQNGGGDSSTVGGGGGYGGLYCFALPE